MINYYILTYRQNYADEFYVHFYDIITESVYEKYKFCKEKIKHLPSALPFGTNEELPFDYLDNDVKFTKITEDEYKILMKCNIDGHDIMEHFFYILDYYLEEHLDGYDTGADDYEDIWDDNYELSTFQMLIDMAVENDKK